MENKWVQVLITICVTLVLLVFVGGMTYSCVNNNQLYYDQAKICVENGGSFVPSYGGNGSNFLCLHSNK